MSQDAEPTRTDEDQLEEALDEAAEAVAVQARELDELEDGSTGAPVGLGHLMDVPVRVAVEVGRTRLTLGELSKLAAGSLIDLDREAHEPADVLVNGKIVARGEIVTIGDHYGVRITSVAP